MDGDERVMELDGDGRGLDWRSRHADVLAIHRLNQLTTNQSPHSIGLAMVRHRGYNWRRGRHTDGMAIDRHNEYDWRPRRHGYECDWRSSAIPITPPLPAFLLFCLCFVCIYVCLQICIPRKQNTNKTKGMLAMVE